MPQWYKKISWAANGVIIGLLIAGLIDRSFTTMVLGGVIGLTAAVIFKVAAWLREQRSDW